MEIEALPVVIYVALFCATLAASLQLFQPNSFISFSAVRLQVSFRLPLLLLPSGFCVSATLKLLLVSLLKMWPIYLQRLSRMISLTGLVLVRQYSSSIGIFMGHRTLIILFKHIWWNLLSFSSSELVNRHNSAPYSKTGNKLLWNMHPSPFLNNWVSVINCLFWKMVIGPSSNPQPGGPVAFCRGTLLLAQRFRLFKGAGYSPLAAITRIPKHSQGFRWRGRVTCCFNGRA